MAAPRKPRCRFCGRKCGPKGLSSHERHCVKNPVDHAVETKTIRDDVVPSLNEITPIRLEAILNGLWQDLSLAQKVETISTLYFDPSNPGND